MKKILFSAFALAMAAFTFTSCEDVPAPYDDPNDNPIEEPVVIKPAGDGTEANPYNVAAAIQEAEKLGVGEESEQNIYIKGVVTNITENYDGGYGNATYYISDDEDGTNEFYIYRSKYFDNTSYSNGDLLEYGDTVVVCGKITNYNGTLETVQNSSYLYSLNGETTPPAPSVDISNTPETAYNVAKAYELIYAGEGLETEVYVKGVIVSIDEISVGEGGHGNATYNINDTDSPEGQLKVFRGYYLGGEKFTTGEEIKVGDEVVVYGKLINYDGTYEINSGNELYSVNGFTTGINKVTVDGDDADAPVYNLAGQRVSKDAKGILIKNGKKFINK